MDLFNKDKLSKYDTSSNDFSSNQLKFGEWYLKHKRQLKKWLVGILSVWSIITLGGSLLYWGYYFSSLYFYDQKVSQRLVQSFADYSSLQQDYQAKSPQVRSIKVVQAQGKDKYNVLANVFNPNRRWVANIDYHFDLPGGKTSRDSALILPGKVQSLVSLGVSNQATQSVNFRIDNIDWRSIDSHRVKNVKNYIQARLNFQLEEMNFTAADSENNTPARVKLTINNPTAYSYWRPKFIFKMYNGSNLVRVKTARINDFITETSRSVSFTFLDSNIKVTRVEIFPEIDIFNEDVFMPPPS